jgi:RNA polymerase sigma factor (sigma-70 family)
VFLRVHLNIHRLDDPQRLAPWLTRLSRNLAIDWQRRGIRRSQIVPMVSLDAQEQPLQVPDTQTQGVRETMEAEDQRRAVQRAIDRLPADQREVVLLHYSEGMKQVEIAERLGVRPNRVHRLLKRGLSAMRGTVEPTLREAAPTMRMPRSVATKTSALIATAAAMSTGAREALAAAAVASTPVAAETAAKAGAAGAFSAIAAKMGSWSLVPNGAASLAAGGTAMISGKGAVAVVVLAAGSVAGYQYLKPPAEPDMSEAVVQETFTPAEAPEATEVTELTGPVSMVPTYTEGHRYRSHAAIDIIQDMRMEVSGRPPEPDTHVEMSLSIDSEAEMAEVLDDGSVRVVETMDGMQMESFGVFQNGQPLDLPPEANPMEMLGNLFQEMRIETVMDRQGVVTSMDMGAALDQEYFDSSSFVQELIGTAMSGYPDRELAPGDTWTREVEIPRIPGLRVVSNNTLQSVEDRDGQRVAVIMRDLQFSIPQPWTINMPANLPIPADMDVQIGNMQGRMFLEETAILDGMLPLHMLARTDMLYRINVSGDSPEGPMNIAIDTRQQQNFTVDVEHLS